MQINNWERDIHVLNSYCKMFDHSAKKETIGKLSNTLKHSSAPLSNFLGLHLAQNLSNG
jgi:hypothetical protein